MKNIILVIFLVCLRANLSAQALHSENTDMHTVKLDEITVTGGELETVRHKVRSEHVYMGFTPDALRDYDSIFYLNRFPRVAETSIGVHSVDLKLASYDTSMFDIRFMFFQIVGTDTVRWIIPIDGSKIENKKYSLRVTDYNVRLKPADFYVGYGFRLKKITEPIKYRMYSSRQGVTYTLKYTKEGTIFRSNPFFPFMQPITIHYYKL